MIQLTHDPIDTALVLEQVRSNDAGAVVLFLGTARQWTEGQQTESLDYECYADMAQKQLSALEAEALRKWPIIGCAVVHRLGRLAIGEVSVAIAVSSPHRRDAFEAGQWLIDTIKRVVPIWKRENWADGTHQWVHPGTDEMREKQVTS
jgi:molybdopterin synthase catalytic subunit